MSALNVAAVRRPFDMLLRDVAACNACERMRLTHALTPANGPLDARVLFVAEAVGRRGGAITGVPLTRDETGRRFERFLALASIDRRAVFVTNAVLCHPFDGRGHNRTPSAAEVARCRPFLHRTIQAVRAPVIVTLGRIALEAVRAIGPHDASLAADTGTAVAWNARTLIPLYHPSRQSTLHRPQTEQDEDWRRLGDTIRSMPVA